MPFPPLINVQDFEATSTLKGSSWLSYNGLLLTEVLTESYDMQEVRTQDGAQRLAIHHVIKIIAILNPQVNSFMQNGADSPPSREPRSAAAMAGNIALVRDFLLQERKLLKFAIGGTVVVQSPRQRNPQATYGCDSFEGPKPLYCQITQITGTSSFFVRFGIECWTDPCLGDGSDPNRYYIQSHRWTMAHDVDGDTWLTSRMVTGHIKMRPELFDVIPPGAILNPGQVFAPDQVARKVGETWMHPLPQGFKRQNVRIQAHPNNMELTYSFVDVEQPLPLGTLSPATKLSAEFSLASSLAEGKPALTQAAVHVAAVGPKNQFRMNLLIQAMTIALKKLQKPGLQLINEVVVSYSLDQRFIDLSLKAIWKPVGIGVQGLQLADTGLKAADDQGDLDDALAAFRDGNIGEAKQGSESNLAQSPLSSFEGRNGTFFGLCVGSSLVNGCYTPAQPLNYIFKLDNDKVERQAEFNADDEQIIPPMTGIFNVPLPFDIQETTALTIDLLDTGLSERVTNSGVGLYEEWYMTTRYRTVHQKAAIPVGEAQTVTSPGDPEPAHTYVPPQIATLGQPYTFKTVDYTIAWIGDDPSHMVLPSPDTGDSNDVLLAEDVTPAVPTILNSTNKSWRVSGTYWYMSKKLRTASNQVMTQFTPSTSDGFNPGLSITDPNNRQSNTIGQSRFLAGYSPSFVG